MAHAHDPDVEVDQLADSLSAAVFDAGLGRDVILQADVEDVAYSIADDEGSLVIVGQAEEPVGISVASVGDLELTLPDISGRSEATQADDGTVVYQGVADSWAVRPLADGSVRFLISLGEESDEGFECSF